MEGEPRYIIGSTEKNIYATVEQDRVRSVTFDFFSPRSGRDQYTFNFAYRPEGGRDSVHPVSKTNTVGSMPYAAMVHREFAFEFDSLLRLVGEDALETARARLPAKARLSLDECVRALSAQPVHAAIDDKAAKKTA